MIPLLTDNKAVADFFAEVEKEPIIAVDLEADSLHSYSEKVCLLQVTIPGKTVLIDPLAADDLSPLGAMDCICAAEMNGPGLPWPGPGALKK